eukprot:m.107064 g.107064  ORF g.107064 m.107064 type:complete len:53 (-) comp15172_c0_seq2:507-665(-)
MKQNPEASEKKKTAKKKNQTHSDLNLQTAAQAFVRLRIRLPQVSLEYPRQGG